MVSCLELEDIESWEYVNESTVYDICVQDNHNYYLSSGKNILVHNSGKTYALIQVLFTICMTERPPKEDPIITIVAESVPNLKKGAYRTAKNILSNNIYLTAALKKIPNETDRIIQFKNGWIMEFNSYENEQQAKQGKRQYLFANECQSLSWPIFWQLAKRTRTRVFVDYNPSSIFWVHDNLIGTTKTGNDLFAEVQLIISDHRHNPFLSENDHARTENIKDPERWKVYARGLTGNVDGLIHPNWKQIEDKDFPDVDFWGGLDFGYTSDETCGVKLAVIGNNLFVHELCYETALPPIRTNAIFKAHGFTNENPVYCDHDPEQIAQLRRLGLLALPANKRPGSVKGGILKVNEFNVFVTKSSKNVWEERKKYKFKLDPITGKFTNTPVDGFDHGMNSIRMGVYTRYFRQGI